MDTTDIGEAAAPQIVVRFEEALLRDFAAGEEARLGLADDRLVIVLVRMEADCDMNTGDNWYLEAGFGPCDKEGVRFGSLLQAEDWIRAQLLLVSKF